MSTFVLKRNYELQLPMSFVDVDRDEMEYVDGGWAISYRFRGSEASTVFKALGWITAGYGLMTLLSVAGGVLTSASGWGAAAFAIAGGYSGYMAWKFAEAYNDAGYALSRYGSFYVTLSGIGPLITGVKVNNP